jgi:hypothetical protein
MKLLTWDEIHIRIPSGMGQVYYQYSQTVPENTALFVLTPPAL